MNEDTLLEDRQFFFKYSIYLHTNKKRKPACLITKIASYNATSRPHEGIYSAIQAYKHTRSRRAYLVRGERKIYTCVVGNKGTRTKTVSIRWSDDDYKEQLGFCQPGDSGSFCAWDFFTSYIRMLA